MPKPWVSSQISEIKPPANAFVVLVEHWLRQGNTKLENGSMSWFNLMIQAMQCSTSWTRTYPNWNLTISDCISKNRTVICLRFCCLNYGARPISVIECSIMVQWVVGLIPHGGVIKCFFIPTSAAWLVYIYYTVCLLDS